MVLERAYSSFRLIASVDVWWYQLVFAPIVCDGCQESRACFIVEDVRFWCRIVVLEALVNIFVRCNSVCVLLSLEWAYQNGVGLTVQCNHDVLVATTCSRCKSARIVRENVVAREDVDVNSVGGGFRSHG